MLLVENVLSPSLRPDQFHHLRRVLRVADHEIVTVADGKGFSLDCVLSGETLEPVGKSKFNPRPQPAIGVGVPLLKGSDVAGILPSLVEVGVDEVVLFTSKRCVSRPDPSKYRVLLDRLDKIVVASVEQSRRFWRPRILGPYSFETMLRQLGEQAGIASRGGESPLRPGMTVISGPEGGFDQSEIDLALSLGAQLVSLGPSVLRARTAPLVAAAQLSYLRQTSGAI